MYGQEGLNVTKSAVEQSLTTELFCHTSPLFQFSHPKFYQRGAARLPDKKDI